MLRRRQTKDESKTPADDTASTTAASERGAAAAPSTTSSRVEEEDETTVATQTPELVRKRSSEKLPRQPRARGGGGRSKKAVWFIFLLGGSLGIFGALFFARQQEVIKFDSLADLNLDSFVDVLPNGFVKDMKKFSVLSYPPPRFFPVTSFWLTVVLYIYSKKKAVRLVRIPLL